jgi:penicillin amidase
MEILQAYCAGINEAFSKRAPWEFRVLGYRPEPWTLEDILLLSRIVGYLTLAQSQGEAERLFVEMAQAGVSLERLHELFPGILGGLDMDLIRKVKLGHRMVPAGILWEKGAPRFMASNNWVLSGERTQSGKPLLSNDPHLEVNRLPNVWCEIVLRLGDRYAMGGTMPGAPGILSGRTRDVAWGATYTFMDAEDSWVEKCRDGMYYREEDGWVPFRVRREVIKRKKKEPVELLFYENEHGVLDGDPSEEGHYLATRWACSESGGRSLSCILGMWDAETVEQAMDLLGRIEVSFNFVLADTGGNIGYQMSGLMPRRREGVSGFVPLPGWETRNDWQGFVGHEELPRSLNPEQGFFATANEDLNEHGTAKPINMPMGSYRSDRIASILKKRTDFTFPDMVEMHFDVYSLQAEAYMEVLTPLLPDTDQGRILRAWDRCYTADSRGAFLFEAFLMALYREVFGKSGFGEPVLDFLLEETGTFIDFYRNFDRVLLSETSSWFGGEDRERLYERVAARALDVSPKPWGETRRVMMGHILFGGKLPRFLGFDRGPITIIGSRATIHQGQIYRIGGRTTSFCPGFRIVTDFSRPGVRSNLAGGPSDRRFSRWYCSDLENWKRGECKTVVPIPVGGRFP